MTSVAVGNRRLLKLAGILDKADALHRERGEPKYDQGSFNHGCGTPSCAWGHWVANDKGCQVRIGAERSDVGGWLWSNGVFSSEDGLACGEFALSSDDASAIFGGDGCGGARTAEQAARFIRAFVKRRSAP